VSSTSGGWTVERTVELHKLLARRRIADELARPNLFAGRPARPPQPTLFDSTGR
jgi:hypothetical protein